VSGIIKVLVTFVCKSARFVLVQMTVLLVMVILSMIQSYSNVHLNAWKVVITVIIQILVNYVLKDGH